MELSLRPVRDLRAQYEIEKGAFASGLYAQLRRARSRLNGHLYAAKISPKRTENFNEIKLLKELKNKYIISYVDSFATESQLILIMEFAQSDLQSLIDADIVLLEHDAKRYVQMLLRGLEYIHSKSIAHLDIKPQNLLLMGDFPKGSIKICDFELSRVIGEGKREILGTPDYIAPEILNYTDLTTKSDIWSTGVVAYVLLTGFSPFGADTDTETFTNILKTEVDFPIELFEDSSCTCIEFIKSLLEKDPSARPSAIAALSSDWFRCKRFKSKSSFDLSECKTKSRERLMEKMNSSTGMRKIMSKSREQLWKSKITLTNSTETIQRCASVSEFPSLTENMSTVTEDPENQSEEADAENQSDNQPRKSVQQLIESFDKGNLFIIEEDFEDESLKCVIGNVSRLRDKFK